MNKVADNYDLIHVFTEDDIKLSGLYSGGDKKKSACIFLHGFTSDFYSHEFYRSIANKLKDQGNSIILAQTRGTGVQTEFLRADGTGIYIGSFFEKLDEAHLDISAFVKFLLEKGYEEIALMGHSLGTYKCVRYLFEGQYKANIKKLVLLAPFDKNAFIETKAPGKWREYVEVAKQKISEGKENEIVPIPLYEDYAMSYGNYYSWYEPSDLNYIWDFYRKDTYDFPLLKLINIPVKVILGEKDEFVDYPSLGVSAPVALAVIKKHIPHSKTVLIPNSNHTYFGYDKEVVEEVASFL